MENFKTVKVVFVNNGENRGTYGAHCFLESFKGDINEKCQRFVNHDFDMLVETDLYRVIEIKMPIWFTEKYYLSNEINLKFSVALGGEQVYNFNETQFKNFNRLGQKLQYWYEWSKKSKNKFIQSLRNQFNDWLSNEDNKYTSPFSYKQIECAFKFFPHWEADNIATRVYWQK